MSTSQIKQVSDNNPNGTLLGQSTTDKIGFYGLAVPIVQPTVSICDSSTTVAASVALAVYNLKAALVALNLVA